MKKSFFSATGLKCIAIVAMVMDHIGAELLNDFYLLRIVGRLTLPIMAYFIAIGYEKTHDLKRYVGRLLFWGVLSIVPYAYYFESDYQNVLFTLAVGLVLLWALDQIKAADIQWVLIFMVCIAVTVFQFDSFFLAIGMILIFRYYRDHSTKLYFSFTFLLGFYQALLLYLYKDWSQPHLWIQNASILALPLLHRYNGTRSAFKFGFYTFYPLHLIVLLGIKTFLF
ncbi:TraX family protein [Fusibacter ferrireducens]|uniref:TraX protein n=1 Tax=Fusibacter ferrireducens TaxID=2785058 RepID=A0ABS0A0C0_9FIRM|nr:TraX family protein [Fusibacter ferrireducens]MBF4695329.1 hypothetical protein [Fusibacter ferrireducens]